MACYSYWESLQYVSTVGAVSGVSGLWHSKASWCRLLPPPAPAQPWLPATNAKSLSGAYDVYLWTPPPQEPDSPMVCDGVNTELVTMQCMQLASSVAGGFRSCLRQFRSCSGHVQVSSGHATDKSPMCLPCDCTQGVRQRRRPASATATWRYTSYQASHPFLAHLVHPCHVTCRPMQGQPLTVHE